MTTAGRPVRDPEPATPGRRGRRTSRSTASSSRPSPPSTGASRCWWPRPPARARPSWPSTPWPGPLAPGGKAFYTTPIKALSNQKYHDLVAPPRRASAVGLLTGDNAINGDAPIVVMTTEVLRNMIYAARAALDGLRCVVLDEVHYLQDAYRGPVWEEVMVHLPPDGAPRLPVGHRVQRRRAGRVDRARCGARPTTVRRDRAARRAGQPLPGRGHGRPSEPSLAPDARRRPAQPRRRPLRRRRPPSRPGGRPRRRWYTPRAGSRWSTLLARARAAAGHLLHLQPGRVRRRGAAAASTPGCASPSRRSGAASARSSSEHVAALTDDDLAVLGYDRWLAGLEAGHRRPPRRHGAAVQGGGRGLLRRGTGARWCSPPRPWPSASTCRPAPW